MTLVAYGFGLPPSPPVVGSLNDTGIVNRNLSRRINKIIYSLKRLWGGSFTVYQMGNATTNHLSGVKDVPRAITHIRRGLILPSKSLREFQRDISLISANKAFVMGGTFDTSTRTFVVDRVDAPNLELTVSDWVVYDNRRYEVKEFTEFEFDSAWVIVGRAIEGEIPEQIRLLCADNLIRLDHSSVQTK